MTKRQNTKTAYFAGFVKSKDFVLFDFDYLVIPTYDKPGMYVSKYGNGLFVVKPFQHGQWGFFRKGRFGYVQAPEPDETRIAFVPMVFKEEDHGTVYLTRDEVLARQTLEFKERTGEDITFLGFVF